MPEKSPREFGGLLEPGRGKRLEMHRMQGCGRRGETGPGTGEERQRDRAQDGRYRHRSLMSHGHGARTLVAY